MITSRAAPILRLQYNADMPDTLKVLESRFRIIHNSKERAKLTSASKPLILWSLGVKRTLNIQTLPFKVGEIPHSKYYGSRVCGTSSATNQEMIHLDRR